MKSIKIISWFGVGVGAGRSLVSSWGKSVIFDPILKTPPQFPPLSQSLASQMVSFAETNKI